jgi:hypothetical protein
MTWIMVDVETDGPAPGLFSMISLGAAVVGPRCSECSDTRRVWDNGDMTDCRCKGRPVEPDPRETFYGRFRPLDGASWQPDALAVSGHSREECEAFPEPEEEMRRFAAWLDHVRRDAKDRLYFVSDNNGFDWQFVNWYFWRFLGRNPFGHSSTNLGSLYKGLVQDTTKNFKHLRRTQHTHHPVDDALGNVEALVHLRAEMGLKISW